MRHTVGAREGRRYEARLLDGPLAGARVHVNSLPGGDPLDTLPIAGEHQGAYVLAGLASWRGYLPYRWVTSKEWAGLRRWLRFGKVGRGTS